MAYTPRKRRGGSVHKTRVATPRPANSFDNLEWNNLEKLIQVCDQLMDELILEPVFRQAEAGWDRILEEFQNNFPACEETDAAKVPKNEFMKKEGDDDDAVFGNESSGMETEDCDGGQVEEDPPEPDNQSEGDDVFYDAESKVDQEPRYICPEHGCGRFFNQKHDLRVHMKPHDPIVVTCKLCGMQYTHRKSLQYHLKSHGVPPYACVIEGCLESFDDMESLGDHEARCHCKCQLCGRQFSKRNFMKMHMNRCPAWDDDDENNESSSDNPSEPDSVPELPSQPVPPPTPTTPKPSLYFELVLSSSIDLPKTPETNPSLAISVIALAYFQTYGLEPLTLPTLDSIISSGRLHHKVCTTKFNCDELTSLTPNQAGAYICSERPFLITRIVFEQEVSGSLSIRKEMMLKFLMENKYSLLSVSGLYLVLVWDEAGGFLYLFDANGTVIRSVSISLTERKARVVKFLKNGIGSLMEYLRGMCVDLRRMSFSIFPVKTDG